MNELVYGSRRKTYALCMTAVMSAVTCVLAPFSIPIGPVPISLTNLAVYFSLYLLGWKMGTVSYIVYLFIGLVGVPVFSGFTAGVGRLAGPTGGYLVGFIPMAVIAGLAIERFHHRGIHLIGMMAGTALCYALGTAWFCISMKIGVIAALGQAVFPFIPFDIAKMILALSAGPVLRTRLIKAGLLSGPGGTFA